MPSLLPIRDVALDDIISANILGDDSDVVAAVLKIHLALEAILIETIAMVQAEDEKLPYGFWRKVEFLADRQVISDTDAKAYGLFNKTRNEIAHVFGQTVTLNGLLELARKLEGLRVDFSDSVGGYSEEMAEEFYGGTAGVLTEIGWSLLFHAGYKLAEVGGRDIFATQEK
ncbi:hypothetical protein [Henriciella pelagia]|uniref:DUF86 domain-containing protein n=1 Tax=Henriciella pelagia TaxID=1977912 RepID=A0ABQ1JJH3_9PROT|nr:hypothetical protein [Henriciella pelagia]GGB67541.1 hypothetical protein GCM10011503_15450 [Henriciella pelagia]